MKTNENNKVRFVTIDESADGQRIDNFLIKQLKGVPKSLLYRLLRKGEIRVNKKRIKPDYKLQLDDVVRIAPIRVTTNQQPNISKNLNVVKSLESKILFEDDCFLVLNKPSGMAVHGGSGVSFGVIEALRSLRPEAKMLELVHRLDRDTSGCLVVAKKRSTLRALHQQLREKQVRKYYQALVKGHWPDKLTKVSESLQKNELKSGERIVVVDNINGKAAETRYKVLQRFNGATLIRAFPVTGRTHQIRVHCQCKGHPIAGDTKYSEAEFEQQMKGFGLKRLFLHASEICFIHPKSGEPVEFYAKLDAELSQVLNKLPKKT